MILYLEAETDIPDLVIDFIEVRLRSGKVVSLNWDESGIERCPVNEYYAAYEGVYFDEEYQRTAGAYGKNTGNKEGVS